MIWKCEYNNEVGPENDEGFWEWWEVTDGKRVFKSKDQGHAEWLTALLNEAEKQKQA